MSGYTVIIPRHISQFFSHWYHLFLYFRPVSRFCISVTFIFDFSATRLSSLKTFHICVGIRSAALIALPAVGSLYPSLFLYPNMYHLTFQNAGHGQPFAIQIPSRFKIQVSHPFFLQYFFKVFTASIASFSVVDINITLLCMALEVASKQPLYIPLQNHQTMFHLAHISVSWLCQLLLS